MGKKEPFHVDVSSLHSNVTGSCIISNVRFPDGGKLPFITDCGLFQSRDEGKYNDMLPFNPEQIEFGLVTHGHTDHIGRLPLMVRRGFRNPIYTTRDTQSIMAVSLPDSAKVIRSDVKSGRIDHPIYTDTDVARTMQLVKGCNFEQTIHVNENVDVTFFNNGHLFGAALVLVQIKYPSEENINILFTGDYKGDNVFLNLAPLPEWLYELPITIVSECTYGYMDSSEIKEVFSDNVLRCVRDGGTVVVPTFALGRMQEVLYLLKRLENEGLLPLEIPIYVDGELGIKYTKLCSKGVFNIKEEMKDFLPENVIFVDKLTRRSIIQDQDSCKIIVTTSGMGSFGPAQTYIPAYISNENALIHFTGFTVKDTLGGRLKNTPKGEWVEMMGKEYRKLANVEYTSEFSAHAKADELIAFLQQFKHLNLVLLNHGEESVKDMFAKRVMQEVNPKAVALLGRGSLFRINPYGLVKIKAIKFI